MALLKIAAKKYIQRVSVILSSPLLDWNKVKSTNEFALSTFVYLMWTQRWPLAKLRQIDQRLRKIIANGGRHPTSSNATLLLSWRIGAVEQENKLTNYKIKATLKMYENPNPMIGILRMIDEKASELGHHSFAKDAVTFAR